MSKRIQRVNQLIKKELGKILLREGNFPKETLVTLTRVETSVDLREAKVWISVFPENQTVEVTRGLKRRIYNLQQRINKTLKMRPVPKIKFLIETKSKEAARIEELLEKIKKSD
ncbi:30S ribosome-binding factor RbfA [Patescibacteria group bacterium]|nr:30S ribosome-binding factor RbfA [Patescibacteria group bacterium]